MRLLLARKPQTWSAEVITPTGTINATIVDVTALTQHGTRQLTVRPAEQWSPATLPIGALVQVHLRTEADPSLRVVPDAWLTATGDLWYVDAEQRLARLDLQPLGRIAIGVVVPAASFSAGQQIIPGSLVTGKTGLEVRLADKKQQAISNNSLPHRNNTMAKKQ
jgi:hypothetical protein